MNHKEDPIRTAADIQAAIEREWQIAWLGDVQSNIKDLLVHPTLLQKADIDPVALERLHDRLRSHVDLLIRERMRAVGIIP